MKRRDKQKETTKPDEQVDYEDALKDLKTAAVRMELRRHGLDPYELSQKDFDEVRRLYQRMEQVDTATNSKIQSINQEAIQEKTNIGMEISEIIKKVFAEQHPGLQAVAVQPPPEAQPNIEAQVAQGQAAETNAAPGQDEAVAVKEQEPGQEQEA